MIQKSYHGLGNTQKFSGQLFNEKLKTVKNFVEPHYKKMVLKSLLFMKPIV